MLFSVVGRHQFLAIMCIFAAEKMFLQASQLYKFEKKFEQVYPENRNIQPKIRQQLQFLRNIGLVKKTSGDRWIKNNL